MSIRFDITAAHGWYVGEDKLLAFDIIDAAGAPLDVTAYGMEWVLRRNARDTSIAIVKATGGQGITVQAGEPARVLVDIEDTDTLNLLPGTYAHSLRRTDEGNEGELTVGSATLQVASSR